jgi:hypothetical protein
MENALTEAFEDTFAGFKTQEWFRDVAQKKESAIREAFEKLGFKLYEPDFIKTHVQIIIKEGDPFEHYYYNYGQPGEVRVISIDRMPHIETIEENFSTKMVASYRAY